MELIFFDPLHVLRIYDIKVLLNSVDTPNNPSVSLSVKEGDSPFIQMHVMKLRSW